MSNVSGPSAVTVGWLLFCVMCGLIAYIYGYFRGEERTISRIHSIVSEFLRIAKPPEIFHNEESKPDLLDGCGYEEDEQDYWKKGGEGPLGKPF